MKLDKEILNIVSTFINENRLAPPKAPMLLACSGGSDSMAAAKILAELGFPLAVAHCNFRLRPEAAAEQDLVREYAAVNDIGFYEKTFDTKEYADRHSLSIQEAARKLRYEWLEQERKASGSHFIVTAHHSDDNAETVLLNFFTGTGVKGMTGIPVKNDKIIRPFLCVSKADLKKYAADHSIPYMEDSSNLELKYKRNLIRHKIIPVLEEANDKAVEHINAYSRKAGESYLLMQERIRSIKKRIISDKYDAKEVKTGYLRKHGAGRTILYEILKEYGFSGVQAYDIYNHLNDKSGKEFHSASHKVIMDRISLFITPLATDRAYIQKYAGLPQQIIFNNYKIKVDRVPARKVSIKKSSQYAYFDMSKIEMPLTIRYWKPGDYFYPLGLTKKDSNKPGKKKLSKYFKDEKISVYDKQHIPVLFSGEKLIWLLGHRVDHRFRVTDDTTEVLKLSIIRC